MINHLVVSWIQVIGLVVSLYGFFFLASIGVFGGRSLSIFRPLIPATATALLGVVLAEISAVEPLLFAPVHAIPSWIVILVAFLLGATVAYVAEWAAHSMASNRQRAEKALDILQRIVKITAWVVFIIIGGVLRYLPVDLDFMPHMLAFDLFTVSIALFILIFVSSTISLAILSTHVLDKDRLQVIGYLLSVLGILTGFLPAILDVFGVTISQ